MKIRVKQNYLKVVALLVCVCLIITGGLLLYKAWEQQILYNKQTPDGDRVGERINYNDRWYQPRGDIESILVLGLDKFQNSQSQIGYLNDQQSDFVMVLILDKKNQKCDILHLNRDTMTEIQRLGVGGGAAGTFTGQLALAHTFGSGGSDSCLNSKKAVSKLLGNVKIDHYLALTMDAVSKMNDLVGGVEVAIMDDFSSIDPTMVQGKNVRLTGQQALTYVRARSSMQDNSNLHRMERQGQYIEALYQAVMECVKKDDSFLTKAFVDISGYFTSDYSVNQLNQLVSSMKDYSMNPIRTVDGEAVKGAEFMEFYVDKDSLQQTVVDLFYEPCEETK